ncbi:endonuclease/exonuclease/phosphatase family protein [Pseudoalteromonas sp. T1lg65]|uniref:endonuclease/exonuclease/phosphatase family protein n=1 Tax=Pseudoalteromonas sp. T1lg65 TaxID=2077101 RepID=UPI003F7AAB35
MIYRLLILCFLCTSAYAETLRVATFNVSMEATNYQQRGEAVDKDKLATLLATPDHQQIKNIAEIIQRVRPDIILLNEFDYISDPKQGIQAFIKNYLNQSQQGQPAIDYPYFYIAPVNTGLATPFDLDNNGKLQGVGGDAQGFGFYEGHYAMAILSKYPIENKKIRTMQTFLWKDMPNALITKDPKTGKNWYNEAEWNALRLSSKSHWDVPVLINGKRVHVLAMHPTPPVFDGEEDRNGKRNHDEIRLMADYIDPDKSSYIYDDNNVKGGLSANSRFVILGDLNAADMGDKHRPGVIEQLLQHPLVNGTVLPTSEGGAEHSEHGYSKQFTAHWGARVDYVLPSNYGFQVTDSGVFWPIEANPLHRLIENREASSDHRLVWIDVKVVEH